MMREKIDAMMQLFLFFEFGFQYFGIDDRTPQIEWLSERAVRCRGACRTPLSGCLLPDVVRCDWGGNRVGGGCFVVERFERYRLDDERFGGSFLYPRVAPGLLFGRTPRMSCRTGLHLDRGRYPFVRIVGLPLLPLCTLLLIRSRFHAPENDNGHPD